MVELSTRKWEIRGDGGNHHEKLGLREFCVQVNRPSPIRQVQVPIRQVITPIRGLPNPIRHVVPLISHIRSYPPYHSHLQPPSLSFSSTTEPSSQNTKLSHPSQSLHDTIMCWHRVQHSLSTASTQDCLFSLHSHDYEMTPECSFGFWRTSLHHRLPSACSPWELKGKVTFSHSHGCEVTNRWIESHHLVRYSSTTSKYLSNLNRSRPPSASPKSLDYSLPVRPIMASKCISKLAQLQPPSLHDHGLQVAYLQTRSITATKCIPNLAQSGPPSSHEHGLQVHLQTPSIMIWECISKFTWSRPPSVSPNTLDFRLQVHLQTRSITALEYISEFTQSSVSGAPRIALKHCLQPVQI